MKKRLLLAVSLITLSLFTSCANDSTEPLNPTVQEKSINKTMSKAGEPMTIDEILESVGAKEIKDNAADAAIRAVNVDSSLTGDLNKDGYNTNIKCHSNYNNPTGLAYVVVTSGSQTYYRLVRWYHVGAIKYYETYEASSSFECAMLSFA
jgi:hypothetical protein